MYKKKAVGGDVLTRYLLLYHMHFHSIEAWKKSMLKVKNVKKVKKKKGNFKTLWKAYAYLQTMVKTSV